jgi:hypothetical protein
LEIKENIYFKKRYKGYKASANGLLMKEFFFFFGLVDFPKGALGHHHGENALTHSLWATCPEVWGSGDRKK